MSWADLFERTASIEHSAADIHRALERRRSEQTESGANSHQSQSAGDDSEALAGDPMTRVVADADVLALDVLVDSPARNAMDLIRSHDWLQLLASEPLLADASAVLDVIADEAVRERWEGLIEALVVRYEHPAGDHPALATAVAGEARHVLSLDDELQSVDAGVAIRRTASVETSVRSPDAFVRLFDPETVYEAVYTGPYRGPDREPRE